MFSVIFPGQGSQIVGMGKVFFDKYKIVKELFKEADDVLNFSLSKIVLDGPKEKLDLTDNTQPAIFLVSYSIFSVIKNEFNIDLNKAKYFAGHSLGEYSALSCAGYLSFSNTLKLLRSRGRAMQNAVPKGEGGMVAVLGSKVGLLENIINENKNNFLVQISNDNSDGQIVLSGKNMELVITINAQIVWLTVDTRLQQSKMYFLVHLKQFLLLVINTKDNLHLLNETIDAEILAIVLHQT